MGEKQGEEEKTGIRREEGEEAVFLYGGEI